MSIIYIIYDIKLDFYTCIPHKCMQATGHESQQHLSHSSISTNGIFVFKDIGLSWQIPLCQQGLGQSWGTSYICHLRSQVIECNSGNRFLIKTRHWIPTSSDKTKTLVMTPCRPSPKITASQTNSEEHQNKWSQNGSVLKKSRFTTCPTCPDQHHRIPTRYYSDRSS